MGLPHQTNISQDVILRVSLHPVIVARHREHVTYGSQGNACEVFEQLPIAFTCCVQSSPKLVSTHKVCGTAKAGPFFSLRCAMQVIAVCVDGWRFAAGASG